LKKFETGEMFTRKNWILLSFIFLSHLSFAQNDTNDSTYYVSYEKQLTGRFYFSQKYTAFRFVDNANDISIRYLPRTTLNMGVGATYKWATLNLAYGFNFLNPSDKKGETKYLDLQVHLYGRKFLIDGFGQFYDGFYLTNKDLRDAEGNYYTRPDISVRQFGASAQYMLNNKRFSYRAGFLQNEWQKKSAGTFLLGWQLTLGHGEADSTIVPGAISMLPSDAQPTHINFAETGPTFGYAYSLVIKKNFFVMASGTMALSFGSNKIETSETIKSSSFLPNFGLKGFIGYNSEKWAFSATWTNNSVNFLSSDIDQRFSLSTGNFRVNFVRRFPLKKDILKVIEDKL
jgi:hypothetical protein